MFEIDKESCVCASRFVLASASLFYEYSDEPML